MEFSLNLHRGRVRASERAPRNSQRILERLHALAKIVERGADVHVERLRVTPPHLERGLIILTKNASRHGRQLAQEFTGISVALQTKKERRVVVGLSTRWPFKIKSASKKPGRFCSK